MEEAVSIKAWPLLASVSQDTPLRCSFQILSPNWFPGIRTKYLELITRYSFVPNTGFLEDSTVPLPTRPPQTLRPCPKPRHRRARGPTVTSTSRSNSPSQDPCEHGGILVCWHWRERRPNGPEVASNYRDTLATYFGFSSLEGKINRRTPYASRLKDSW